MLPVRTAEVAIDRPRRTVFDRTLAPAATGLHHAKDVTDYPAIVVTETLE
jgi:hypothetical protein